MLRVRIDGGQLTTEQLRVIAGISTEFGRDTADLTDRQNIQLHWIRGRGRCPRSGAASRPSGSAPPRRAATCRASCSARPSPASPPTSSSTRPRRSTRSRRASSATRRSRTCPASSSRRSPATPARTSCTRSTTSPSSRVEHPELGIGYDLWVGGGLSTAPRLGERLGVFVAPERVADAWHGVAQIFRDYGYRRLRNKARLKFLLAEWGTEKFRQVLQDEYLGYALPDGPAAPKPLDAGRPRRRAPPEGRPLLRRRHADRRPRLRARPSPKLADLIEAHGSTRLRTTPHQKLVILDIPEDRVESLIAGLDELGLSARPSLIRRGTIACTGIEFCKLAIVETKAYATAAVLDLEERLARLRPAASDLACTSTAAPTRARASRPPTSASRASSSRSTASRCPATRCTSAAGSRTPDRDEAGLGRTVRGLKVTADGIADYVERVVRAVPRRPGCRIRRDLRPVGAPRRRERASSRMTRRPLGTRASLDPRATRHDELRALAEARQRRARQPHRPRGIARRGRRLGRAQLRRGCRGRRLLDGRRRAAAPRRRAAAGRRRALPRHRLPLRRDARSRATRSAARSTCGSSTCCPSRPSPSRTPSSARSCYARDPGLCCARRKVAPLQDALGGYEVWFTGVRREEAPTRANTPLVTWDERNGLVKVNPVAAWTFDDLLDYAGAHQVPVNLLVSQRLPLDRLRALHAGRSRPATTPAPAAGPGSSKTECGLHL